MSISPQAEWDKLDWIHLLNQQRVEHGFLALTELWALMQAGNQLLDPFSTLISRNVILGKENLFYPNVIIEASPAGTIRIGNGNQFWPNTVLRALDGHIDIGHYNVFGEGGVTISTASAQATITIGNRGRYMSGAQIRNANTLGHGTQILGAILVQECTLGEGESFQHPDPDLRGGVLKGAGVAQKLLVQQGEVINGRFAFGQELVERQSVYHPK